MDEILTGNYVSKLIKKYNHKLNYLELNFLSQIKEYTFLKLSEKQLNWYLSILSKYPVDEIMPGSVGGKLLEKHQGREISEIEMNHIKSYGNIFDLNENIIKQLKNDQ